jgi:hypothetical protein
VGYSADRRYFRRRSATWWRTRTRFEKIVLKRLIDDKPGLLADIGLLNCILENKNVNDNAKQLTKMMINRSYPLKYHDGMINDTDRTTTSLLFHENIIDVLGGFDKDRAVAFMVSFLTICVFGLYRQTTFQNQTWIFSEMSSIMKIFKNSHLFHSVLPHRLRLRRANRNKQVYRQNGRDSVH